MAKPEEIDAHVVISRFVVANGLEDEVREAFLRRPHLVDDAPGFLSMEVLQPEGRPEEFLLVTRWVDKAAYKSWHRSHAYRDSHAGIPKGLKLVPSETEIIGYRRVCL